MSSSASLVLISILFSRKIPAMNGCQFHVFWIIYIYTFPQTFSTLRTILKAQKVEKPPADPAPKEPAAKSRAKSKAKSKPKAKKSVEEEASDKEDGGDEPPEPKPKRRRKTA